MSAPALPPVPLSGVTGGPGAIPGDDARVGRIRAVLAGRSWLVVPLVGAIASRIWSLILLSVAAHERHEPLFGPGSVTAGWDTAWYLEIANHGYHGVPIHATSAGGAHDYAFFPLWPLAIHAGSLTGIPPSIVAAVLSPVLFCLAAPLVAAALEPAFGRLVAIEAMLLLAFSPAAWTFSMGYSEAMFLVFAASAFLARSSGQRAVAVGLAVVTRIAGLPLVAVDGIRWIRSRGADRGALGVAIVGGLAFAAWWTAVAVIAQDPFGFLKGSPDWSPTTGIWAVIHVLDHPAPRLLASLGFVAIVAAGAFAALGQSWPLGTYALLTLALGFLPGGLVSSMPRYALASFPAYAGLASRGGRRVTLGLLVAFAIAQAIFVSLSFPDLGHGLPP